MIKVKLLLLLGICALAAGCSDPLRDFVNKKFPAISVEQQRQTAITTNAQALAKITMPNIAFRVHIKDAQTALWSAELKKQGVVDFTLEGEKQLLKMRLKFSRRFTGVDAGASKDIRSLLAKLSPEIDGSIVMYAGLTGELETVGTHPELTVRILPALSTVTIERIKLADKADISKVGEPLAGLLNKYLDNIAGELARAKFTQVKIPSLATSEFDVHKSFVIAGANGAAKITIAGNPINVPFKIDGISWLVTDEELTALVQLGPMRGPAIASVRKSSALVASSVPTFEALRMRAEGQINTAFGVSNVGSSNWVAIRKDLAAAAMNSAISQAGLCVVAVAETPTQHLSTTIPMPNADDISCAQDRPCDLASCPFRIDEDTRNCDGPTKAICELAKGAENDKRRIVANLNVADCQRNAVINKGVCEAGKTSARALCEAGRGALKTIGPNFARVESDVKLRTNGVQVCLRDFALTSSLERVQFYLDVRGSALADVNINFTPLDIAGHLTCAYPWRKAEQFAASLRESRLYISSALQFVAEKDRARVEFVSDPVPVKARLTPTPIEFLLNSPHMTIACPIVHVAQPMVLALSPFIKELRGEIDYTLPSQKVSIELALPSQRVGEVVVDARVTATEHALVVTGAPVESRKR